MYQISNVLYGYIGLLQEKGTFEFQDIEGHEVDYVNVQDCIALEITTSNKRSNEMNFKYLPEHYCF